MQRMRPAQRPATDASRTLVIHDAAPREQHPADPEAENAPEETGDDNGRDDSVQPVLVLNLTGGGNDVKRKRKAGQRVVWKEDVVDNEGAGKKKSKICCIYHKPRRWDESSDESSDDSDCEGHNHGHGGHGADDAPEAGSSSSNNVATPSATVTVPAALRHHSDLNAYESQPHRPGPPAHN